MERGKAEGTACVRAAAGGSAMQAFGQGWGVSHEWEDVTARRI